MLIYKASKGREGVDKIMPGHQATFPGTREESPTAVPEQLHFLHESLDSINHRWHSSYIQQQPFFNWQKTWSKRHVECETEKVTKGNSCCYYSSRLSPGNLLHMQIISYCRSGRNTSWIVKSRERGNIHHAFISPYRASSCRQASQVLFFVCLHHLLLLERDRRVAKGHLRLGHTMFPYRRGPRFKVPPIKAPGITCSDEKKTNSRHINLAVV